MRDEIEKYINEHYHALFERPWEKYPNFTTYKHVGNKKWFALVMDVSYEVLNMPITFSSFLIYRSIFYFNSF